jgi:Domain of unknown function (DUF2382)/PRC-barrel domain
MSGLDIDTALEWRGRRVIDRDGEKIGTFKELFLDQDDRPAWAAVHTGLFGLRQTFVPLENAQPVGDELQVPFDEETVKGAPNVDPSEQLSADEEQRLYEHYGRRASAHVTQQDESPVDHDEPAGTPGGDGEPADTGDAKHAATDEEDGARDAMTRSEEEVTTGTRIRERGHARLKKYVVTDHVQKTIPVRREEVRLEFEPTERDDEGRGGKDPRD